MLLSSDQLILEGWEEMLVRVSYIEIFKYHFKSSRRRRSENLRVAPDVVLIEGKWLKVAENKRWLAAIKMKYRLKVIVVYENKSELKRHKSLVDETIKSGLRKKELIDLIKGVALDDKTLCMYYAEKLKRLPAGEEQFNQYIGLIANILQLVFSRDFTDLRVKISPSTVGKFANLVFENNSKHPFWLELKRKYGMGHVVFLTHNNPDAFLNQFNRLGRLLSDPYGNMGFLVNRRAKGVPPLDLQLSKYQNESKIILVFFDPFIRKLLAIKAAGAEPVEVIEDACQEFFLAIGDAKK